MPKAGAGSTIARQWELLKRLPGRRPGATVAELHSALNGAGHDVSKRTIERDLQTLSTQFPIARNDKGTPTGWYWMEGTGLDLPGVSLSDALSLQLVEELLKPLLPAQLLESLQPRFSQAREKLEALSESNPTARWADKVRYVSPTLPLKPPDIASDVLQGLHQALLDERQIDITYHSASKGTDKSLRLHPLGLVQRGSATYLVATTFHYSDRRIYAVQRIRELTITDQAVNRPEDYDLDDYIEAGAFEFGDGGSIDLVATLSECTAAMLRETPLNDSQKLETMQDGKTTLKATIHNSWQLRWWLLSQGKNIVVEQPHELRRWMQQTIANMYNNYGEPK